MRQRGELLFKMARWCFANAEDMKPDSRDPVAFMIARKDGSVGTWVFDSVQTPEQQAWLKTSFAFGATLIPTICQARDL